MTKTQMIKEAFSGNRECFCNTLEMLDLLDYLFSKFEQGLCESSRFIYFNDAQGDCSIISKELDRTPKVINWYKLYHVGRSLTLHGFDTPIEFYEFLLKLRDDMQREEVYCNG